MKRKVIALTGGIGSGKSEVARILQTWGWKTVDCDALARQVSDNPDVISRVETLLGSDCVADGQLNRKIIREKVFKDENLLKQYEQIFFGKVRQLLTDIINSMDDPVVFVEIPVLDAFEFDFAEIWRVESDEARRIERVVSRDNVAADNVKNTIARQKAYANVTRVIDNNGSLEDLTDTVKRTLIESRLVARYNL